MAIPQSFLDELSSRCDIIDIISKYVHLKKSGTTYFGLCPFHNEKTASFSVHPERQIFHCFGCGVGGGVIQFIMQIEGMDFIEAVKYLADSVGLDVPDGERRSDYAKKKRERLLSLNKAAARFYHAQLLSERGMPGAQYLKSRQLSLKTVNNFGLGFAPDGWDNLITEMLNQGFSKEELLDAGLVIKSQRGALYDRFRNRVMFPIINVRGDVIAFGGRVLDDSLPKYLNSPETEIFSKSRNLFALNLARKSKEKRFILCEGYMDVISLHQAGFDTAVASLGTSLTDEQAKLISRYAELAIIAYDSDGAGRNATMRAIEIFKPTGMKVKVLSMTGAKDPDEYIKKNGAHAFALLLDNSENHIEYKLKITAAKYDLKSDNDRVLYLKDAVKLLALCQNSVEREIYTRRAAETAGVSPAAVENEIKREISKVRKKRLAEEHIKVISPDRAAQPDSRSLKYANVRSALAEEGVLLITASDGQLLQAAQKELCPDDFSSDFLKSIYIRIIELAKLGHRFSFDMISADLSDDEINHLAAIMSKPTPSDAKRALQDFIDIIKFEKMKEISACEDFSLEQAAEKYREKKGYGGEHK